MRLFLCEKPSQGKDIGRILGATQRGEGCLNGSGVTVTWCIGHLVEAAAPEAYDEQLKRWSIEQLPIIPQHWRVEVKPKTATQFGRQSAPGEGDPACHRHRCRPRGRVDRPRDRGALRLPRPHRTPVAVGAQRCVHSGGTGQLRPSAETLSMYHSALARSRADWLVGMNLSRLFTVLGRQAGYDGVLSVGRVQTPTLARCGPRPRDRALRVRTILGHRRVPVRRRFDFRRAMGSTRCVHRRRRPLPAAAGRTADHAADPRCGQCPRRVGGD